jgi:hypothetical protein
MRRRHRQPVPRRVYGGMCQLSWGGSGSYLEVDDNGERPTRRHVDNHSFIRLPSAGTKSQR